MQAPKALASEAAMPLKNMVPMSHSAAVATAAFDAAAAAATAAFAASQQIRHD